MGAEKDLNDKITLLASLIETSHVPFNDEDVTRQLVDFVRALRIVRKYSKILKAELGVDPLPHVMSYLRNPDD